MRVAVFIALLVFILGVVPAYVARRLFAPFYWPRRRRWLAWAVVEILLLATPATMGLHRRFEAAWADSVTAAAYVGFGLFLFLLFYVIARDVIWLAFRIAGRPSAPRRRLWLRCTSIAVIAASLASLAIGMWQALAPPRVVRISLPVADLPPDLDGFRIAHLSDIHLGPWKKRRDLARIVEIVNRLEPDIVAITGDFVDGAVSFRGRDAEPLRHLNAPAFFAIGNHDVYSGAAEWSRLLENLGVTVLAGGYRTVQAGSEDVLIAGLVDPAMARAAPPEARDPALLAAGDGPASFRILLAHRNTDAFAAASAGFDLQLSGHTHGGQFFPATLIIPRLHPFPAGLRRWRGMWLYTSTGAGFWGPPVRFLNPPEIALIVLRRAG